MEFNKRAVGTRYESLAAAFLRQKGMSVTQTNFHARRGEIDLIARDGEYLVFVEVKFRTTGGSGTGAEAVNVKKQRTICRVSDYYRALHLIPDSTPVRYDVVEFFISPDRRLKVRWFQNAFPYHPASPRR